jgi:hypothetical protein
VRNLKKNVKRKKNHENNPCTLPTKKNIKKKLNLISIRVKIKTNTHQILRLHVRGISLLTVIKGGRHVTLSSRVQHVDRIRGVPIRSSLGGQTSRLENLQRLDVIFVEEVSKIGRHGSIKCFT